MIEMGARQYSPLLGRFLEVDPVEGGTTTNDYGYVPDPLNQFDLNGEGCGPFGGICHAVADTVTNPTKVARGVGRAQAGFNRWWRSEVEPRICGTARAVSPLSLASWVIDRPRAIYQWGAKKAFPRNWAAGGAKLAGRIRSANLAVAALHIGCNLARVR